MKRWIGALALAAGALSATAGTADVLVLDEQALDTVHAAGSVEVRLRATITGSGTGDLTADVDATASTTAEPLAGSGAIAARAGITQGSLTTTTSSTVIVR